MNKFLQFALCIAFLICTLTEQVPYQVINQTVPFPTVQFYAKSGDSIKVQIQFTKNIKKFKFVLYKTEEQDDFYDMYQITEKVLQNTSSFLLKKKYFNQRIYIAAVQVISFDDQEVVYLKMVVTLNNLVIREHYQPLDPLFHIFEIQTTNSCLVNLYWIGPYLPSSQVKIVPPQANFDDQNLQTFQAQRDFQIQLNLNITGKWRFLIQKTNEPLEDYQSSRIILNITTFTEFQCINSCSNKKYPVVGLAPIQSNICICDESIPGLVWDKNMTICLLCNGGFCDQSVCNNGVKQRGEECDTIGQIGCLNCIIQPGFVCRQNIDMLSVCQKKKENILSPEAIALISIGSGLFILVLIGALYYYFKIYKNKLEQKNKIEASQPQKVKIGQNITQQKQEKQNIGKKAQDKKNYLRRKYKEGSREKEKEKNSNQSQKKCENPEHQPINSLVTCSICLKSQCTIRLACQHEFHNRCILQWFKKEVHCPLCKGFQIDSSRSIQRLNQESQKKVND